MIFRSQRFIAYVLLAAALPHAGNSQGPLQPPGGPAPTMKSLDELDAKLNEANTRLATVDAKQDAAAAKAEKRTPISSLPFTIDTPGSYYLAGNLTGASAGNGITITVSNVTVDLMGHTLTGVAGSNNGIDGDSAAQNITIRNGNVVGWGSRGINILGAKTRVDAVTVANNGNAGMFVGNSAVVVECIAVGNAGAGIIFNADGVVHRSTARENGSFGISTGFGSVVSHCTARANRGIGILAGANAVVQACSTSFNTGNNLQLNNNGIVARCSASSGEADGINVGSNTLVLENVCRLNIGAGIRAAGDRNRIEGNSVTGNGFGVRAEPFITDNLVIKNSASSNTTNYSIGAGNRVGLLVTPAASGAINGNTGGTSISDPWANFAY